MYNGRGYVRSSRLCTIVMVLFNRSRYVHTVIAVTYDVALMYDLYSYVRLSRLRMIVAVMYNCHGCVQSSPLCTIVAVKYDSRGYEQSYPLCTNDADIYKRDQYVQWSQLCTIVAVMYAFYVIAKENPGNRTQDHCDTDAAVLQLTDLISYW